MNLLQAANLMKDGLLAFGAMTFLFTIIRLTHDCNVRKNEYTDRW